MPNKTKFNIDFKAEGAAMLAQLQGVVSDVTDPKFQAVIQSLAADAADIGVMKARGADPLLIQEAESNWKAGLQSAAAVPGLIVANKVPDFIAIVSTIGTTIIATAFNFFRAYAGLPPTPPT